MGTIFSESALTLAATDATDSSLGLFIPARPNMDKPWRDITALPLSLEISKAKPTSQHQARALQEHRLWASTQGYYKA